MSCNPFHQDRVLNYDSELIEIVIFMEDYGNVILDADEDDRFAAEMRKLDIDLILKNLDKQNKEYSGFREGNDSLIIFVKKSHSIIRPEKRIIYDFAKEPRNFGSENITNASYEITQINNRWYYSEVGFD